MTDPHAGRDQPEFDESGDIHTHSQNVLLELLDATDGDGRCLWKLIRPYRYRIGPRCHVIVPAGYVTNFATVPRFFYRLVTPAELREAALIHDYLVNEDFTDGVVIDSGYSRWMADAVLWEVMTEIQINWFKRCFVYAGVRMWAILTGQK